MALAALTGLLIVVVFVAAAATNAVAFSVLVSMTAAGAFLAVLLALLAAAYVCALSVAVLVISATTVVTVIAITIASGTFFRPQHSFCLLLLLQAASRQSQNCLLRLLASATNSGLGSEPCFVRVSGWAAFFWVVWFGARECLNLTTKRWTTGATIP